MTQGDVLPTPFLRFIRLDELDAVRRTARRGLPISIPSAYPFRRRRRKNDGANLPTPFFRITRFDVVKARLPTPFLQLIRLDAMFNG